MADGRMIKKRISKSKKLANLKDDSPRLLYFMIYPHVDVEGRLDADPALIKGECIPLFDWPLDKIEKCLIQLAQIGLIYLYSIGGEQYLELTRFNDFQVLRKDRESKSIIPSRTTPGVIQSKVKLSKDKLIKDQQKTTPSAVFKEIIDRVHKEKKVNISMLINKFKKDQRARKATYEVPEKVYIAVCKTILGLKTMPKCDYPYFMKILNLKAHENNAQENIEKSKQYKTRPDAIKDITNDVIENLQVTG